MYVKVVIMTVPMVCKLRTRQEEDKYLPVSDASPTMTEPI